MSDPNRHHWDQLRGRLLTEPTNLPTTFEFPAPVLTNIDTAAFLLDLDERLKELEKK